MKNRRTTKRESQIAIVSDSFLIDQKTIVDANAIADAGPISPTSVRLTNG